MSEDNNVAPNNNGDNVTGNNQGVPQGNTSTGTTTQNNTGRQNDTRNRSRFGLRDQTKLKRDEEKMQGHVFTLNTEGGTPPRSHDTMERLLGYIGKNYKYSIDIQKLVEDLSEPKFTLPDFPSDVTRTNPNTGAVKVWERRCDQVLKGKTEYADNKNSLFQLVWGQSSQGLKDEIKALPSYTEMKSDMNCIQLLSDLKMIIHRFETTSHPQVAMHTAKGAYYNCHQYQGKRNSDYFNRFNSTIDIVTKHQGRICDDEYLVEDTLITSGNYTSTTLPTVDSQEYKDACKKAMENAAAVGLLLGSDKTRYSNLHTKLERDYTLGNNLYPTKRSETLKVLNKYSTLRGSRNNQDRNDTSRGNGGRGNGGRGDPGRGRGSLGRGSSHRSYTLVQPTNASTPIQEVKCFNYLKLGHWARDCPGPKRSQENNNTGHILVTHGVKDGSFDWTFATVTTTFVFSQGKGCIDPHWIPLDSESTASIFVNRTLLNNFRTINKPLVSMTNGGVTHTSTIAYLKGYGDVWYDEKSVANILSLAEVGRKFRVTFDTEYENNFFLHKSDGSTISFKCALNGLYYHDTRWNTETIKDYTLISTVANNKEKYSRRQVQKADKSVRLYKMIGLPAMEDFTSALITRMVRNSPVTKTDAKKALDIYGPNIAALKGKTTRKKPTRVDTESIIPVPQEILELHKSITVYVDFFYFDGLVFFCSVSRNLGYGTANYAEDRTDNTKQVCIKRLHSTYTNRGFVLDHMLADFEFESVRPTTAILGINLNTTSASEHVGDIERFIRILKERLRGLASTLPFTKYPKLMKIAMIMFCVFWLNIFPRKGGVSINLGPGFIIDGSEPDFNVHCRLPFGSYCQTHEENAPTNTNVPRTIGAITLFHSGNLQGGYDFLSLSTGKLVHRRRWTELSIPTEVITMVDEMAEKECHHSHDLDLSLQGYTYVHETDTIKNTDSTEYSDDESNADNYPEARATAEPAENNNSNIDEEHDNENNDDEENYTEYIEPVPLGNIEDMYSERDNSTDASTPNGNTREVLNNNGIDESSVHPTEVCTTTADNKNDEEVMSKENNIITGKEKNNTGEKFTNDIKEIIELNPGNTIECTTRRVGLRTSTKPASDWRNKYEREHQDGTFLINGRRINGIRKKYSVSHQVVPDNELENIYLAQYVLTQMSVKAGIQKFGSEATDTVIKEWKQIDEKDVFVPRCPSELIREDKLRALRMIMYIKKKRCGRIKARGCADGRKQRTYIPKEEASSPTVSTEGLMISCVVDAKKRCHVATCDINGAFLRMSINKRTYVILTGKMVDLMVEAKPTRYKDYVAFDRNDQKVLWLEVKKALYGCMESARLLWEDITQYLDEEMDFIVNPYDMCVANKVIDGSQCTVLWHVDDFKISHVNKDTVKTVTLQIEKQYEKMAAEHGLLQTFVGLSIIFLDNGKVKFSIKDHVLDPIDDFPDEVSKLRTTPAGDSIFQVTSSSSLLDIGKGKLFHSIFAKLLFISRRERPDIQVPIGFLGTRFTCSTQEDWIKLKHVLECLKSTIDLPFTLGMNDTSLVTWWVDASYGVHLDMKSQTGGVMFLGKGATYSCSRKQKLNTVSSTEAELVGTSDILPMVIWVRMFLDAQGLNIKSSKLHQDNKSTIQLIINGRLSSSKRTRHIAIQFYFIKDYIDKGEIHVVYCPTENMLADFVTKPLQGKKITRMRDVIMGVSNLSSLFVSKEGVGLRAQHAIIRDENVPNKASKNVDVALKLNTDDASKDDDIDIIRGIFPANHGILKDVGTATRRRTYKEVLNSFE